MNNKHSLDVDTVTVSSEGREVFIETINEEGYTIEMFGFPMQFLRNVTEDLQRLEERINEQPN